MIPLPSLRDLVFDFDFSDMCNNCCTGSSCNVNCCNSAPVDNDAPPAHAQLQDNREYVIDADGHPRKLTFWRRARKGERAQNAKHVFDYLSFHYGDREFGAFINYFSGLNFAKMAAAKQPWLGKHCKQIQRSVWAMGEDGKYWKAIKQVFEDIQKLPLCEDDVCAVTEDSDRFDDKQKELIRKLVNLPDERELTAKDLKYLQERPHLGTLADSADETSFAQGKRVARKLYYLAMAVYDHALPPNYILDPDE